VPDEQGRCTSAIVCPFHGWVYNLDGTLRGAARPSTLPALDSKEWGLKPIEMELWQGFIFVRFLPGDQPSVATLLASYADEVKAYGMDRIAPAGGRWSASTPVNWKSVRDVDNEGYHVAKAHPGLHDLYGQNYVDEPFTAGVSRSFGVFNDGPGHLWSVRHYKNLLPVQGHLPESHRRAWLYIGLFPNTVLTFYPDSVMFYQEFPLSAGVTLQAGRTYAYRDEDRQLRAARYLSARIDRATSVEDVQLTVWSYEAAQSSGFDGVILSDLEYGVRSHHDHLRRLMPVLDLDRPPAPGGLASANARLLERASRPLAVAE
jgi:phenylpropionate dioxygenase-like ring-hydroxylating dioxygenase large terminal subunit